MRISRASGQPGLPLVGGATSATFTAVGCAELTPGGSTRGGIEDGVAVDDLPPNMPGTKCRAAMPALASNAMRIRPLVSPVRPPGRLVVVVIWVSFAAVRQPRKAIPSRREHPAHGAGSPSRPRRGAAGVPRQLAGFTAVRPRRPPNSLL